MPRLPSGCFPEFWFLSKPRKSQERQNPPVIAQVHFIDVVFSSGDSLFLSYFKSLRSSGWWRAHFKQWTAWWRWRSVVKSGGCPWYPWQRRTGQLVKFSEACRMERERKLPLQMGAPLPPPAPANHSIQRKFLLSNTLPLPAMEWAVTRQWKAWKGHRTERCTLKAVNRKKGLFSEKISELEKKKFPSFSYCHFPVFPWQKRALGMNLGLAHLGPANALASHCTSKCFPCLRTQAPRNVAQPNPRWFVLSFPLSPPPPSHHTTWRAIWLTQLQLWWHQGYIGLW